MGLGGLLARIGRGALKAAPKIHRASAGVAAAFGNRAPLDSIRQDEREQYSREMDERNLERQERMDVLAEQESRRRGEEFEWNRSQSQLQRTLQQRQLDLLPKSREEQLEHEAAATQRSIDAEANRAAALAPSKEAERVGEAQTRGYTPEFTYEAQPKTKSPIPELAGLGDIIEQPAKPVLQRMVPPRDYLAEANAKNASDMNRLLLELGARKEIANQADVTRNTGFELDARQAAIKAASDRAGPLNWMTMSDEEKEQAIEAETTRLLPSKGAGVPRLAPGGSSSTTSIKAASDRAGPLNWMTMSDEEKEQAIEAETTRKGAGVPRLAPGGSSSTTSGRVNPFRQPTNAATR